MVSLPLFRSRRLPQAASAPVPGLLVKEREAFLHLALVGMALTVTALLGYMAVREESDEGEDMLVGIEPIPHDERRPHPGSSRH